MHVIQIQRFCDLFQQSGVKPWKTIDHALGSCFLCCRPRGLIATADKVAQQIGVDWVNGGIHPRFGTRNVFSMENRQYFEIVEVLEHPAPKKHRLARPFEPAPNMGGGWMGWVVSVDDMTPFEERLDRRAVPGGRTFPDGRTLEWEQIGIKRSHCRPPSPLHLALAGRHRGSPPIAGRTCQAAIESITIAGNRPRVRDWLGLGESDSSSKVSNINTSHRPALQALPSPSQHQRGL